MRAAGRMRWLAVALAGLCVMVLAPGAAVHAAASRAQARHQRAASPGDGLDAVAALGESDAWAVGFRVLSSYSGGDLTLTEHWDGERWKVVPSPSPGGTGEQAISSLDAVAFDSPDDGWAVGDWSPPSSDPTTVPPSYGLIEHWNGVKWTALPSPSSYTNDLSAVAAISPTAAWATGLRTAGKDLVTVFMRWNGTNWRYLPSLPGDFGGLAVISARDIWTAGSIMGTKPGQKDRNVIERWNGSKWTIVPSPTSFKSRTPNIGLGAVGGSSASNLWAVGIYQTGKATFDFSPLIEHWDGRHWRVQPCPDPVSAQAGGELNAIAAVSGTSAWAIGNGFDNYDDLIPIIEGWNGVRWTAMRSRFQPGVTDPFPFGVAAVNPRYAWVVGSADNRNNRPITFIEKWNGTSWQQVPSPNP